MSAHDRTWMEAIIDDASMNPVPGQTHGSIDVTTAGTILTKPANAARLIFQPTSGSVRWMIGGTATATNGFLMAGGAVPYTVMLGPNTVLSFAATTGTASFHYQFIQ